MFGGKTPGMITPVEGVEIWKLPIDKSGFESHPVA